MKPNIKPDTWNQLRNAPPFGYGLFPDDMICIAEQDITGWTGWRGQHRYKPYERRESRGPSQTDQTQPWRQFARGWGRNRGRGHASNPRFSRPCGFKNQK